MIYFYIYFYLLKGRKVIRTDYIGMKGREVIGTDDVSRVHVIYNV